MAGPGQIRKSSKLDDVCYDIRGPVLAEAHRLEEEGHRVFKLNIGNPAPWGFEAPEEILLDVIHNLPHSQGYCESKGLYSARKAIMQYCQQIRIPDVEIDDIYIGNGSQSSWSWACRAAGRRRRGADPSPGLPALDRRDLFERRPRRSLPM